MSEPLSSSEVQSLFAGLDLSSGATSATGRSSSAEEPSWSSDQFTLPITVAGEELARLQSWQSNFGASWSRCWNDTLSRKVTIENADLRVIRLRDYVTQHVGWAGFQVTANRHDFPVWLALDEVLITTYLGCLLGDQELAVNPGRRARGPLENQLTSRLVNTICEVLFAHRTGTASEWQFKPVSSVADWIAGIPVYLSCEIVQFDFEVLFSGASGRLSLGIPRGACDRLLSLRSPASPNASGSQNSSATATVQLRATLAPISLSATEFQQLQIGDVLLTPQTGEAPCLVSVNGQPTFTASIGAHQNHKAIRLTAVADNARPAD